MTTIKVVAKRALMLQGYAHLTAEAIMTRFLRAPFDRTDELLTQYLKWRAVEARIKQTTIHQEVPHV